MAKFPQHYVNDTPKEGDRSLMEYVDFDNLGIGARKSGMPKSASEGPKPLEHVGSDATSGGRSTKK